MPSHGKPLMVGLENSLTEMPGQRSSARPSLDKENHLRTRVCPKKQMGQREVSMPWESLGPDKHELINSRTRVMEKK